MWQLQLRPDDRYGETTESCMSLDAEFIRSPAAKYLWEQLSPQERKTVKRLRLALRNGSEKRLSTWHLAGRLAAALTDRASHGQQFMNGLATLIGVSPSVLHRARKFVALYDSANAERLEGKLGWSRIGLLVGVANEGERNQLERDCIDQNWSVRRLQLEIRGRLGRQRQAGHGGRPSRRPQTLVEALSELDRLLSSIVHWYGGLESRRPNQQAVPSNKRRSRSAKRPGFEIGQFPPPLWKEIEETMRRIHALRLKLEGALAFQIVES
jgi:DUF1016 N-terminal domain